jgi:hypothetical protein
MPQALDVAHFEIDHIRSQVHGGQTVLANLPWTCFRWKKHSSHLPL